MSKIMRTFGLSYVVNEKHIPKCFGAIDDELAALKTVTSEYGGLL